MVKAKAQDTPTILDVLETATEADLETLRADIQQTEHRLTMQRALERVLMAKFGMEQPKRGPGGRVKSPSNGEARTNGAAKPAMSNGEKLAKILHLIHSQGPMTKQKISTLTGIPMIGATCVGAVVNNELFHVNPDGVVSLTDKGEVKVRLLAVGGAK